MGGRIAAQQRGTWSCASASRSASSSSATPSGSVEGDVGGRIAARSAGDLVLRARLPQRCATSEARPYGLSRGTWAALRAASAADLVLRARHRTARPAGRLGRTDGRGRRGRRRGRLARARGPACPPPAGEPAVWSRRPGREGRRGRRPGRLVRPPGPARPPPAGATSEARRTGSRGGRGRPDHGPAAQRPGPARPPPAARQQHSHAEWVVEGDVGGRITGQQRGNLVLRARLPEPVQQPATSRPGRGGRGQPDHGEQRGAWSCAPDSCRLFSRPSTAPGCRGSAWAMTQRIGRASR